MERATNDDLDFARVIGRLEEGMSRLSRELDAMRGDLKTANDRLNEVTKTLNSIVTGHRVLWVVATILGGAGVAVLTLFSGYFDKTGGH